MRKFMFAATAAALCAAPGLAAPGKPMTAAMPEKGTGCIVRGAESQPYQADAACEFHIVTKANADGSRVFLRYQDKGTLQTGQDAPKSALNLDVTQTIGGQECTGKETITPNGNYSSMLTCK